MSETRTLLEHEIDRVVIEDITLDGLRDRRARRQRNQRVAAFVVVGMLLLVTFGAILRSLHAAKPKPAHPTPSGPAVSSFSVPGRAMGVAKTKDAVWVGFLPGKVLRFDPTTGDREETIDLSNGLVDNVYATGEVVWIDVYGFSDAKSRLEQVDAETNEVIASLKLSVVYATPSDDGLWVCANADGGQWVYRVDPATRALDPPEGISVPACGAMVFGDGAVWMIADHGNVIRVHPDEGASAPVMRVNSSEGLAWAGGRIWGMARCRTCPEGVTARAYEPSTGRESDVPLGITEGEERRFGRLVLTNRAPMVVSGGRGAVWIAVADYWAHDAASRWGSAKSHDWNGELIQLDVSTGEVRIVPLEGSAWVGSLEGDLLWLFDNMHASVIRVNVAKVFP